MVQAAKALGRIDIGLCDGPIILNLLKEAAQEYRINPEDSAKLEAAIVRFRTPSRRKALLEKP
jgi:hypothetical protein